MRCRGRARKAVAQIDLGALEGFRDREDVGDCQVGPPPFESTNEPLEQSLRVIQMRRKRSGRVRRAESWILRECPQRFNHTVPRCKQGLKERV
jgi:hypothetical protein